MQTRLILFSLLISLTVFVIAPAATHAVNPLEKLKTTVASGQEGDPYKQTELEPLVGTIIKAFLSLLGVAFLLLTIYGGFIWMNAQGAEEEVTKAKKIITQAVIGLVIIMAAYAISYFVTSKLQSATTTESAPATGL